MAAARSKWKLGTSGGKTVELLSPAGVCNTYLRTENDEQGEVVGQHTADNGDDESDVLEQRDRVEGTDGVKERTESQFRGDGVVEVMAFVEQHVGVPSRISVVQAHGQHHKFSCEHAK